MRILHKEPRERPRIAIVWGVVGILLLSILLSFGGWLAPSAAAKTCGPPGLTGQEKSRDAQFFRWLLVEHVIHVGGGVFEGAATHYVGRGQPMILGFEWVGLPVDDLNAGIIDNPDHDIRVVVDGSPVSGNWKQYYQRAFEAVPQCGPNWAWDHDGDGPGDGNGNGIDDFAEPVLFWRAPLSRQSRGSHSLSVEVTFDGGSTWVAIPGGTIVVR